MSGHSSINKINCELIDELTNKNCFNMMQKLGSTNFSQEKGIITKSQLSKKKEQPQLMFY